jgi:hypothetical protein
MDNDQLLLRQLLQAECLVAVLGIERTLAERPKPPTKSEQAEAEKMQSALKAAVAELVAAKKQRSQAGPPVLPSYREIDEALRRGLDHDVFTDALLPVSPELIGPCAMVITRGVEYLSSLFPRRIEQRLTGPYLHDPAPGEYAEFGWAWRIANRPMAAIELASDGMLIGTEVRHLQSLYPAIYSVTCEAVYDALTEQAVADKEWMPPWWLQKQLCTILGISAVSDALVADIDAAVKASQAETKTRASALKLSHTGQTTSERLAESAR